MAQLNVHINEQFEEELARLMRVRGIHTKSEAVRTAVRETLQRSIGEAQPTSFRALIGLAAQQPENPRPRFRGEDDLWEAGP